VEAAMHQVKVTQIGNSLGVVLPKELVERLGIARGQMLSLSETTNGLELSAFDPEFEEQMRMAEEIMDRYRDTLRELAK
jgi:putative addiction module antidote